MKKYMLLLIFTIFSYIGYAQIAQFGIGFTQSYMKDCQSNIMLDVNFSLSNIHFAMGTTLKGAKESEHGKGQLTSSEQQKFYMGGFNIPVYKKSKDVCYITPLIGYFTSKYIYSDRMYNRIQYKTNKERVIYGAMISAMNKHGVWIGFKATNAFAGLSIGYCVR